jgi:hypothetical protein
MVEQLADRRWETGSDKKILKLYKTHPSFGMAGEMNWQNAGYWDVSVVRGVAKTVVFDD